MAKEDICGRVESILEPWLKEHDLELYRIEYKKEGPGWVLRVFLDKPEGAEQEYLSIDECEAATRYLDEKLDEQDFIDRSYNLEVSSPGLDRELIKESDFVRFAGRSVEIKTYEKINGSREHEGILVGKSDGNVIIESEGAEISFPADQISKINLAVIF